MTIILVAVAEKNAMNEQAMAVAGQRSTTGADLVRAEVLARIALGHSKRKIARDLHIFWRSTSRHRSAPLGSHVVSRPWPTMRWRGHSLRTNGRTPDRSGCVGWSART